MDFRYTDFQENKKSSTSLRSGALYQRDINRGGGTAETRDRNSFTPPT